MFVFFFQHKGTKFFYLSHRLSQVYADFGFGMERVWLGVGMVEDEFNVDTDECRYAGDGLIHGLKSVAS